MKKSKGPIVRTASLLNQKLERILRSNKVGSLYLSRPTRENAPLSVRFLKPNPVRRPGSHVASAHKIFSTNLSSIEIEEVICALAWRYGAPDLQRIEMGPTPVKWRKDIWEEPDLDLMAHQLWHMDFNKGRRGKEAAPLCGGDAQERYARTLEKRKGFHALRNSYWQIQSLAFGLTCEVRYSCQGAGRFVILPNPTLSSHVESIQNHGGLFWYFYPLHSNVFQKDFVFHIQRDQSINLRGGRSGRAPEFFRPIFKRPGRGRLKEFKFSLSGNDAEREQVKPSKNGFRPAPK